MPRSVAMAMVGHKTEAIYRRYSIVDKRDLENAAAKLDDVANGPCNGHARIRYQPSLTSRLSRFLRNPSEKLVPEEGIEPTLP